MTIDKVKEIISAQLNRPVENIKNDSKIIEDLGADSLDVVEMLMTLEETFGISISDDDTSTMKTIEDVAKLIDNKLAK